MLYHPHAPIPLLTLRSRSQVKVTDIEFLCLMKCLYHISQLSESIHISNMVCFHSITTDPRVHAMEWGWRSKYRTSSYSSEFEFSFFFFLVKCILILLARQLSVTGEKYALCTVNCLGGLPRNSVNRLTDRARNDPKSVKGL